jgi:hypothetical protein
MEFDDGLLGGETASNRNQGDELGLWRSYLSDTRGLVGG